MRDVLTSPRVKVMKHKRRVSLIRFAILIFVFLISLVGALAYFSGYHRLTIHTVTVTGTQIINISDVQSVVQKDLAGKYMYLFARSDTLIYPHDRIYNDLIRAFPRIQTLSVTRSGWNTLVVAITERAGSFLYCGAQIPANESDQGDNCYFVNNDGYIFDQAPYFSGNIYFKYYLDLGANTANPLGTQMLPPDTFHQLTQFVDKITALGFKPAYLSLDSTGMYTLYLDHAPAATSPVIMFTTDNDLGTIADNLSAAMGTSQFTSDINSKYDTLLYIDLRFTDKVLYKFQ
jgi:hypothetical protein